VKTARGHDPYKLSLRYVHELERLLMLSRQSADRLRQDVARLEREIEQLRRHDWVAAKRTRRVA
jgi:hypothetical protein